MTYWEELQAAIRELPDHGMLLNHRKLEYMLFWAEVHGIEDQPDKCRAALRGFTGSLAAAMLCGAWLRRNRLAEQGFEKPCLPEGTDLEALREKALKGLCWCYWGD